MADSYTKLYAGKAAAGFMSASLLSGETLAKGNLTVLPNVAFKVNLNNFNLAAAAVADATCDFTSAGSVTLTERIIQPEYFQVNQEMCLTPFQSDWEAAQDRKSVV